MHLLSSKSSKGSSISILSYMLYILEVQCTVVIFVSCLIPRNNQTSKNSLWYRQFQQYAWQVNRRTANLSGNHREHSVDVKQLITQLTGMIGCKL